jgi:hypothetical protein
MKNSLALLGLFLAVIGLGIAMFQDDLRDEQATTVESVAQQALDKGTEIWSGDKRFREDAISYSILGLGLVGFVLGLGALLKKENGGLGLLAMVVGGVTMSWHWLINVFG